MARFVSAPASPPRSTPGTGTSLERKQILDYVLDNDIPNVVAITGDIHTFFTGTAYTTGRCAKFDRARGQPEFVGGGSATSTGLRRRNGDLALHSGRPGIDVNPTSISSTSSSAATG